MPNEFALIETLLQAQRGLPTAPSLLLGPGDDCALIAPLASGKAWAITTDMLVTGVHFLDSDDPHDLGWKTLAVNLSDLAAMGAAPRFVTLAAAITAEDARDTGWITAFFAGFSACAEAFGVRLIGGDTTHGPRIFSVTALGEVCADQALRRSGAQADDDIWVSGTPGYAALGLQAKLEGVALPYIANIADAALHRPQPRVALGLALNDLAHSAIDVSDGLLQDLGHIGRASGLRAELEAEQLPACPQGVDAALWQACLLGGGDDYELLFTAPAAARARLNQLAETLVLPLTRIGQMRSMTTDAGTMPNAVVLDAQRQPLDLSHLRGGFDHFAT